MNAVSFVAGRILLARSARSRLFVALAFVGIAIAVAALVLVTSVMNGFRDDLMGRILGLNGHVTIYGPTLAVEDDGIRADVAAIPGVTGVRLVRETQALVRNDRGMSPLLVRFVSPAELEAESRLADAVEEGSLADVAKGGIAIGRLLADRFGVSVGDTLPVIVPDGVSTPFGTFPATLEAPVRAVFAMGMYDVDSMLAFADLEASPDLAGLFPRARLDVFVTDRDDPSATIERLESVLSPVFTFRTWHEEHAGLIGALRVERNVMFLILSLIVVVVGLNIVSGLATLARDRRRDIAHLQVMGMSRTAVVAIFLLSGAALGIAGTLVGLFVGVPLAVNIAALKDLVEALSGASLFPPDAYLFDKLPSRVDTTEILVIGLLVVASTVLAAIPSALRATTNDPAEVLRDA